MKTAMQDEYEGVPVKVEEDDATREWLVNVMSNQRMGSVISSRVSRRFSAFDRPRKSIMTALSRLSSAQLPHLDRLDDQVLSPFRRPPRHLL